MTALVAYLDADPLDRTARSIAEAEAVDPRRRAGPPAGGLADQPDRGGRVVRGVRRPFLTELSGLGRRRVLDAGRLGGLYEDASSLLDRLLLRLIATHQEASR